MGLLDSAPGAVINNASQGGCGGRWPGRPDQPGRAEPQLIQAVMSLISNDGPLGGLPGLMAMLLKI
jgi:hypothetical protein